MHHQSPLTLEHFGVISLSVRDGDPAPVREQATLSREESTYKGFLSSLLLLKLNPDEASSLLYVETCHRVELYFWNLNAESLLQRWLSERMVDFEMARIKTGVEALRHLVRVTASLDSEVLGETQITGQIKDAAEFSRKEGWLRGPLDRCVQQAFRIAKRIRSSTALGVGTVSVAHAAVDGLNDVFDSLNGKSALVVGAGAMAKQALERLLGSGLENLTWINRNQDKITSLELAKKCQIALFDELHRLCWSHDIVVLATSSPLPILKRRNLTAARTIAGGDLPATRVLLDLGLPRNAEAGIADIEGFFLRNVDEFKDRAEKGSELRSQSVQTAELILEEELSQFLKTWNNWEKGPMMGRLYHQVEALRKELMASQIPLEKSTEFDYMLRGVFAKLMHRLVDEVDKLDDASSSQVIETLLKAWRPNPTWQLNEQDSDKTPEAQNLSPLQKPKH